jgi:rod shape-determining protein MreC
MDLFKRHLNLTVLVAVLFVQVIALAYQVKRSTEKGPVRLIRVWGVNLITPAENAVVRTQDWVVNTWNNYFYLRNVRRENERLREENLRLRLEQVRMSQDASQAQRLQALLRFKEQFISETVAAQVIGSSGSEQSRVIYIDKGAKDGIKPDMAVITPGGIVGKVMRVFPETSQVLEINDQSSGLGAILEKSRLQGILKGTASGETMVHYIMGDERVEPGENVLTSGGDRIFPKGLPIGTVVQVNPGPDAFLRIRVKPSARLDRIEEVLVITRVVEKERESVPEVPLRASDILAQRLPTVPPKPPAPPAGAAPATTPAVSPGAAGAAASGARPAKATPASAATVTSSGAKPADAKPKLPQAAASSAAAGANSAAGGHGTATGNKPAAAAPPGAAAPAAGKPVNAAAKPLPQIKAGPANAGENAAKKPPATNSARVNAVPVDSPPQNQPASPKDHPE